MAIDQRTRRAVIRLRAKGLKYSDIAEAGALPICRRTARTSTPSSSGGPTSSQLRKLGIDSEPDLLVAIQSLRTRLSQARVAAWYRHVQAQLK